VTDPALPEDPPAHSSLRSNLLSEMLLPMLVVMVLSGILSHQIGVHFAGRSFDQGLADTASLLALQLRPADGRAHLDLPEGVKAMLKAGEREGERYQVLSLKHGLLAGSADLPLPALSEDGVPQFFTRDPEGRTEYGVAMRVRVTGADDIVIQVVESGDKRRELAQDVMVAVIAPQGALLLLALLAVRAGIATSLKPLQRLAGEIHERRAGDLTPFSEAGVPDEVLPLTSAINASLHRLAAAMDLQHRFIADASHQLRTPLAAVGVKLEQTLREVNDQSVHERLVEMRRTVERLTRLSNQLLILARAESASVPSGAFAPVDLRALAFDLGMACLPRAMARGADLGFAGPETPVWVSGDAVLLGELLRNLLENALNYAASNGRITLSVEDGAEPALQVEDDGPGIPEADRMRVFERFHRVPGSLGSGSGLGLAIVQQIADLHGAHVSLRCPPEGGAVFRVQFPARILAPLPSKETRVEIA